MRIWDLLKTWRRPTRPKRIGLVLSGGAVRGAAHLGVLQVFNEHGIRPDLVVGASAGAVVGGLYCAGLSPLELQKIFKEMHWHLLGCLVRPGLGFFDISRMEEVINDLTGGVTIEELEIPFAAVAVDVLSGELIVLRQGSLARAIRAEAIRIVLRDLGIGQQGISFERIEAAAEAACGPGKRRRIELPRGASAERQGEVLLFRAASNRPPRVCGHREATPDHAETTEESCL